MQLHPVASDVPWVVSGEGLKLLCTELVCTVTFLVLLWLHQCHCCAAAVREGIEIRVKM